MTGEIIKTYTNGELTIVWKPGKCIHSGVCVRTLPQVYNLNTKPWITIENATTEELKDQLTKCPSGALNYFMNKDSQEKTKFNILFTVEEIEQAHSKVKSGADFPRYIREIKAMGVKAFETWVKDSHTEYFGADNYRTSSTPMYKNLSIADTSDKKKFEHCLKIHQQGQTDYFTFCRDCAETGIEKWFVSLDKMTCTYYDKSELEVLVEAIPG